MDHKPAEVCPFVFKNGGMALTMVQAPLVADAWPPSQTQITARALNVTTVALQIFLFAEHLEIFFFFPSSLQPDPLTADWTPPQEQQVLPAEATPTFTHLSQTPLWAP